MIINNPILRSDFPDPDVVRVGNAYYMISTTMHFMPGAIILRSYDLLDWEILSHVFEKLDSTPAQRLEEGQSIYGQGMWAASLRHHAGTFHVCFSAKDTGKTYLYRTENPEGPWRKSTMDGFYHDPSLLFDDDGRVYLVYGNSEIHMTELDGDLTGPKPDGSRRVIVRDEPSRRLGYEGSHAYKINGRYYVFLIHWLADGSGRRTEACFASDSLEGEFKGRDVFDDDLGFFNQGVAQGGIVDTPEGDWYALLFQDRGAVGRVPVLVPMRWENDFPLFGLDGETPQVARMKSAESGRPRAPICSSDDFRYAPGPDGKIRLGQFWQWNHEPRDDLWSVDGAKGELRIMSGKISENLTRSVNTLTQRSVYPTCAASVRVDASGLREGDYAGICALQGRYGLAAITRREGRFSIVMKAHPGEAVHEMGKSNDFGPGVEYASVPISGPIAQLRAELDFTDMKDEAVFSYRDGGEWKSIGPVHKLRFGLDHFTGCRFGLFLYSTAHTGGVARFGRFEYDAR